MQTKIEEINPQIAETYLNKMIRNRPISNRVVTKYAGMMKKGQWLTTHQGIAFDDTGALIDGQHRLWAVIEAQVTISIMVTRGIPAIVEKRGVKLASMDAVDTVRVRSTADQLFLSHEVCNAPQVQAAFCVIAQIVGGAKFSTLTVPQAVSILPLYGKDAEIIISELKRFKPVRVAAVAGTLAFARAIYRDEIDNFTMALVSGAGLKNGDPCLTLRNKLISSGLPTASGMNSGRLEGARMVANAFVQQMHGKSLQVLRPSEEGMSHLRDKQKSNLAKIRSILGINEAKS